jgi:ABC-type amino acid transport system permease subunit
LFIVVYLATLLQSVVGVFFITYYQVCTTVFTSGSVTAYHLEAPESTPLPPIPKVYGVIAPQLDERGIPTLVNEKIKIPKR